MKRIYTYILMIVCATMFAGCQKDWDGILTAEIEDYRGGDSKVYINTNNFACWHHGDKVWLNGEERTVEISGNMATIQAVTQKDSYTAYYPFANVTANVTEKLRFAQNQQYRLQDGKQVVDAPMMAYTTDNNLMFKNVGSLLKVTVPQAEGKTVRRIEVTEMNSNLLSGEATCTWGENNEPKLGALENGNRTIGLDIPSNLGGVNVDGDKTFYVAIPPVTGAQLRVSVIYKDNDVFKSHSIKTGSNNITIERNEIVEAPMTALSSDDPSYTWRGAGTEADPYLITSAVDFEMLEAKQNNSGVENGKFFKQVGDIVIDNPSQYSSIGTSSQPFKGIYDGGNYTIFYSTQSADGGIFGYIENATIKNVKATISLSLPQASTYRHKPFGGIINKVQNNNKIINCHVLKGSTITNNQNGGHIGGICGECSGCNITIQDCSNSADLCNNYGNIYSGGIVSKCLEGSGPVKIERCYNYGNISGGGYDFGGMVGNSFGSISIIDCINKGTIDFKQANMSYHRVGGLLASNYGTLNIRNSANYGDLKVEVGGEYLNQVNVGGLVGIAKDLTIENSYTKGKVVVTGTIPADKLKIGGIYGELYDDGTLLTLNNIYVGDLDVSSGYWVSKNIRINAVVENIYRPALGTLPNYDANSPLKPAITTYNTDNTEWYIVEENGTKPLWQALNDNRGVQSEWGRWVRNTTNGSAMFNYEFIYSGGGLSGSIGQFEDGGSWF